jgi:hypothetical protein|tara:strand:+ start:1031 stop:1222 length:192 start_codon:yes stop_codon:yes gene_type:complete
MFSTFVMACSILTGQCIVVEDVYGPYNKEIHCEQRASQIVVDVAEILGTPHTFSFKCKIEKGI